MQSILGADAVEEYSDMPARGEHCVEQPLRWAARRLMKDHQDTDDSAHRAYRKRQDAADPHSRALSDPILGTTGWARRCHGSAAGPHGSADERGSRTDAERPSSCLEGSDP